MQNTTFTGNAIAIQPERIGFSILDSSIIKGYKKRGLDVTNFVHHPDNIDDFEQCVDDSIAFPVKVVFCISSSLMKRRPSLFTIRFGCINVAGIQSGPISEFGRM